MKIYTIEHQIEVERVLQILHKTLLESPDDIKKQRTPSMTSAYNILESYRFGYISLDEAIEAMRTLRRAQNTDDTEKLHTLRRLRDQRTEAKAKPCTCSSHTIQYEGGCQCERGKRFNELNAAVEKALATL